MQMKVYAFEMVSMLSRPNGLKSWQKHIADMYGLSKFRVINFVIPANWNQPRLMSLFGRLFIGFRLWMISLSGVPDFFDRNKILSGYDLSHYQVPHCIRVFFYFVWFVFIHHNFQFYFELYTYCNILDIYLSQNLNFVNYLLFYMKLLNYLFLDMFGSVLECYELTGVSLLWPWLIKWK